MFNLLLALAALVPPLPEAERLWQLVWLPARFPLSMTLPHILMSLLLLVCLQVLVLVRSH